MRKLLAGVAFLALIALAGAALADDTDGRIQMARDLIGQADALIAAEQAKPPLTITATVTNTETQTITVSPAPSPSPSPSPPPSPTPPPGCTGVNVTAPASIQNAIDVNPAGTTFCLSGTFHPAVTILPKADQRFVGPASIVGPGGPYTNGGNEPDDYGFETRPQAPGAEFIDLDVSGFEIGIRCWEGVLVQGGRVHHNLNTGIGCGFNGAETFVSGVNMVVDNVEVDHNGHPDWLGCCASGMKFAVANGVTVKNSFVHDNIGNGVWCDVQCGDYTVIDNLITSNSRKGVFYEKSGATDDPGWPTLEGQAYIARNTIQGNGTTAEPFTHGGIVGTSSKNMLIENNILGGDANGVGIRMRQDDRISGDKHGWILSNIVIRNNVLNGDDIIGCTTNGQVTCTGNG